MKVVLKHRRVKTIDSFKNLKKDLQKSTKAYYMAELIHKSVEEDEQVSIYLIFCEVFEN